MKAKVELSYMKYASLFDGGQQLLALPKNIQDAIEDYMNHVDEIDENSWYHPNNLVMNHLRRLTKRAILSYLLKDNAVSDEEVESWDDEVLEGQLHESNEFIYLGEYNGIYYVM